jgi:crotonobetaine/carnitine-CoA ligase
MTTPKVIGQVLRQRAGEHSDQPYLWSGDQQVTYGEMDARSDQVAAGLAALGITPGDRVAIIASNRMEMVELFFAVAKLGAVQVPLNAFLKGEFLRYQLEDSQAETLRGRPGCSGHSSGDP